MNELKASHLWWLPADIGIAWGADLSECKEQYSDLIVRESETQLCLQLRDGTQANNTLILVFNDAHHLERLQEILAIRRDFWDGIYPEEFRPIEMKYKTIFLDRLAECQSLLGRPDFLGEWDSPGYPDEEMASPIAIWELDECRIQLEYDHQDKEIPIIVRITTLAQKSHF